MADLWEENLKDENKKKKKRKKKILIFSIVLTLVILVSIFIGCFVYAYTTYNNKIEIVEINKDDLGIKKEVEEKLSKYDPLYNIALFGIDSTDGFVGRSDSIMILTIDKIHNKLKVSSIMRDSYVKIPKHKNKDKINHAYAYGGPELALRTINENFNLNIKDFVSVNFTNMPKIIDLLGGMTIDLTKSEVKFINDHIDHLNRANGTKVQRITEPGSQHLNGTQVLAYSRIRYTDGGDSERAQRHRLILNNLFELFKKTPSIEYPKLLNELLPMVKTSLTFSDILDLASSVLTMGNIKLEQYRFPREVYSEDIKVNDVYYLAFDKEITIKEIHDYIFEDIKPEDKKIQDNSGNNIPNKSNLNNKNNNSNKANTNTNNNIPNSNKYNYKYEQIPAE